MAEPEIAEITDELGNLQPIVEAVSTAGADCHTLDLLERKETVMRRAGCLNWARPDL